MKMAPGTREAVALLAAATTLCVFVSYALQVRSTSKDTKLSKALRREQQRELRRQQKDQQLLRKKHAHAIERENQEQSMTDEQKRERMERIKMQRVEQYQKMDDGMLNGLRIVVDLAFAASQTERECHSIFKQLGCVYGYMKKCPLDRLISLRVASYAGPVVELGQKHGLAGWKIHLHEEPLGAVYEPEEIVYLSPDATDILTDLDPNVVYVIGGIVDRSVRKGQSLEKASSSNVRVKRLPLQEFMNVRKPVLNIDSVLIALLEFSNHRDWPRAFEAAIPSRMATRKVRQ